VAARTRPPQSAGTIARQLAAVGRRFDRRGWVSGTSGNFSAVVSRRPFRLLITSSAVHKRELARADFLVVNEHGRVVGTSGRRAGKPSAETRLHVAIARSRGAASILHTHSVWGTILSDLHGRRGGLAIENFEMLKGLAGVSTHAHREWLPIVANDQDMTRLGAAIDRLLAADPASHGFLIRAHGLYTWGSTVQEAERHVEILEFLLETLGRRMMLPDTARPRRRTPWR
jgi:methylthioribulose-1-phosphate dehydratase